MRAITADQKGANGPLLGPIRVAQDCLNTLGPLDQAAELDATFDLAAKATNMVGQNGLRHVLREHQDKGIWTFHPLSEVKGCQAPPRTPDMKSWRLQSVRHHICRDTCRREQFEGTGHDSERLGAARS